MSELEDGSQELREFWLCALGAVAQENGTTDIIGFMLCFFSLFLHSLLSHANKLHPDQADLSTFNLVFLLSVGGTSC